MPQLERLQRLCSWSGCRGCAAGAAVEAVHTGLCLSATLGVAAHALAGLVFLICSLFFVPHCGAAAAVKTQPACRQRCPVGGCLGLLQAATAAVLLTTKGYDDKTPNRTSFDQLCCTTTTTTMCRRTSAH